MKKLLFSLFFVGQAAIVFAQEPIRVKSDNVNLYRQPSSQAQVIKVLSSTDDVMLIRRFNSQWSIVQAGNETGYLHNSRYPNPNSKPVLASEAQK